MVEDPITKPRGASRRPEGIPDAATDKDREKAGDGQAPSRETALRRDAGPGDKSTREETTP